MIINVEQIMEDNGNTYTYYFREQGNTSIIAYATNEASNNDRYFYYNGKEYCFADKRSFCKTVDLSELKWDERSKIKKSICQKVYEDGKYLAHHYTVGLFPLKSKMKYAFATTVYELEGVHYTVFKVGFGNEVSHFYCIFDDMFRCIGVIERHYGQEIRSSIYIEDETYLLLSLIVCTEETICAFIPSADSDSRHDFSAGNYISTCQDEKELLDREFIKRIKMQQSMKSSEWLADKVKIYNDEVCARSEEIKIMDKKIDKSTTPVFILFCALLVIIGVSQIVMQMSKSVLFIICLVFAITFVAIVSIIESKIRKR